MNGREASVSRRSQHTFLAAWPVHDVPEEKDSAEKGVALCLSGGGYRAMLFHTGALWRLNEIGYLPRLDRVSSVSGGSLTAGVLASGWDRLQFESGIARNFETVVVAPIRRLAGRVIDVRAIITGLFLPGDAASRVARRLNAELFKGRTLQDLPERPRFVFNATNLQSGVLWRFSRPYAWDYRVGKIAEPQFLLADAVAASAAFPPFLSPLHLDLRSAAFEPHTGTDLQYPPFTDTALLADGGVYDNLGLETAFKRYRTILVSDGGAPFRTEPRPALDWLRQLIRVVGVVDSQVRALRKRQLIDAYRAGTRLGAYWGIGTDIANYPNVPDALPCPQAATKVLAAAPTRLAAFDVVLQKRLINWGYAVCDAAMRAHVARDLAPPERFPYSESGVG